MVQPSAASATPDMWASPAWANWAQNTTQYLNDAVQRTFLFWDTLLDRGNDYLEHLDQGTPPLLTFEHEVVLDGHDLAEPCNYLLLKLTPPAAYPVHALARPVIIVDPRAGHGPGIGGFKFDSEVGQAMRAGHPVYFVAFRPEPEDGQTLLTVMRAEAQFIEKVIALHPQCHTRPVVIGNCQAGWATMALNAVRPDLFGPLMVMGAPLSYWAGGSKLNPMRYTGAALGGSWLASFTSDLGADRFDGAYLVENFERLNPAHSLWDKYHRLWANVDTEPPRFLEFERWWGGFFRMTGAEIESIVENLFVGNRLARGQLKAGDQSVNLRNITAPIVVFASWGDNITPPPQALNWIIDTWGDERAIAAAGRTIVYVLHDSVGHLGIFVGGDVARKEHDQLVNSLDVIESLPPGLYEMKLEPKAGLENRRWDELEPGDYTVAYEYRTIQDLHAINPEGREEEALFSTVSQWSEFNANLYKTWARPWVRLWTNRESADALGKLHPLRLQRQCFSDRWALAPLIRSQANAARSQRVDLPPDHPLKQAEEQAAEQISRALDSYREWRDANLVTAIRSWFGPQGLGACFPPDTPDADTARAWAQQEIERVRATVLPQIAEGGFPEAVCRIVLAGMVSIGSFERRSLRLARLLAQLPSNTLHPSNVPLNWAQLIKSQAPLTAVAPVETLNSLEQLLPDSTSRENALALSAAVLMIEPTLANPRSEIIEYLIMTLNVDPERVIQLARSLTQGLERPAASTPGRRSKTRSVTVAAPEGKPRARRPKRT